jgi:hypothetical protein
MKSPFPGMDPFIEARKLWGDFHHALIQDIKKALNQQLPDRYLARTGERSFVVLAKDEGGEKRHAFWPDVNVTSTRIESATVTSFAIAEPTAEPEAMSMQAFIEEEFRETFVEVTEADSEKLVTCVEALSPANKKSNSEGWNVYLRKRQGLLVGRSASLIEIDLLRGGQRMPMIGPWPFGPYALLVSRASRAPNCLVWPAHSMRRLPVIPVPLLESDPDVSLDLQSIIDTIYAESRYHRTIDYTKPITPPLTEEEAAWLSSQLKACEGPA